MVLCEYKVNLVYSASFRIASAAQRNPISKKQVLLQGWGEGSVGNMQFKLVNLSLISPESR